MGGEQRGCGQQGAREHAGHGAEQQREAGKGDERAGAGVQGDRRAAGQAAVQVGDQQQRQPERVADGLSEHEHEQQQQRQQQQAHQVVVQEASSVFPRYVLKRLEIFEVLKRREEDEGERARQDGLMERFTQAAEKEGINMDVRGVKGRKDGVCVALLSVHLVSSGSALARCALLRAQLRLACGSFSPGGETDSSCFSPIVYPSPRLTLLAVPSTPAPSVHLLFSLPHSLSPSSIRRDIL